MLITLLRFIQWLIGVYSAVLVVRCVFDWVQLLSRRSFHGFVASVADIVYSLTEPPLRALRKVFPPIPMGRVQFDTSFIILWLLLGVLEFII